MNRSLRRVLPAFGLAIPALLAPLAVTAQDAAATCEIDQNKPSSVPKATLILARVPGATTPADKQKVLRDVVKTLSEEKKADNPIGRDYMMVRALAYWATDAAYSGTVRRADLGFATSADATIDVLAAIDSAATRIAAAKPGCAAEMSAIRQEAWLPQVNAALKALNANQLDSAAHYARRSLIVNSASPYGHYVLGTIAAQAKDEPTAQRHYADVFRLAGTDTSYRDVVQNARQQLEVLSAQRVRQLAESGDFTAILADPSKYDDQMLVQAGVFASQAKKNDDAIKLFSAALQQNPYQRDALHNLASTYYMTNQFDKIVPVVERLVAIDPSNPDNYLFAAFAYQGLGKAAVKTPARAKVYTDSLLLWKGRSDKVPVRVQITQFGRGADKTTLGGTIEGIAATAKPYTLKFEFLDAKGNVIGAADTTVGPVAKDQKTEFKVELDKGGAVAFRYAPVS